MILLVVILPFLFSSVGGAVQDGSLIFYLPFDEGQGKVARDKSGNGNDGALEGGVAWTKDGKMGNAISFDGVDDYVKLSKLPLAGGTDTPSEYTIEAWIKIKEWPKHEWSQYRIFTQFTGMSDQNITFLVQEKGFLYQDVYPPSGGSQKSKQILELGKWYYVTATRNGKNRVLYINGNLDVSDAGGEKYSGIAVDSAWLGAIPCQPDIPHYFNGVIDEPAVYNRALTQAEIWEDMSKGVLAVSPKNGLAITWGKIKAQD